MIDALTLGKAAEAAAEHGSAEVESALVRRAADGEAGAFRLLVERFQADVFRCCLHWVGSREDAQEVSQDCFVKAWQALPEYEHRGRFRAWLIRIALNLCRDRSRGRGAGKARLTVSLDTMDTDTPCGAMQPDDASAWRNEMEKLERGLGAMPEGLRLPLALCGLDGLSQEECAEVLGLSVRAVEGRVRRARKLLIEWWENERG
jgi:RNA polymerase sigma factor (sigma-70 family)